MGRSACFEGCLRDETIGPSLAVLIDGLIGGEFSLTIRGARCIAEPLKKRNKRIPNSNNPPKIKPPIRKAFH